MSNRNAILLSGLLVTVLIVAAYFGKAGQREISPVSSSYSTFPRGLKALYLYWSESGVPVARRQENFLSLPEGENQVMIVSEPSAERVSKEEANSLLNWIHRGNHLILSSRCGEGSMRTSLDSELLNIFQLGCTRKEDWKQDFVPERVDLNPTFSIPMNRNVKSVSSRSLNSQQISLPGASAVLQYQNRPAAVLLQRGKGLVLFLSSSSIIENAEINRRGNLQWIANFIELTKARLIYFDEYHHGYHEAFSSLSRRRLRVLSFASLQLVAILALFLLAGGRRLGPPRQQISKRGRSALETIESLAYLFLKGKKYRYLAASLQNDLRAALNRKHHLAKDLSSLADITGSVPLSETEVADLRSILNFEFLPVMKKTTLLQFAQSVDEWRQKLRL